MTSFLFDPKDIIEDKENQPIENNYLGITLFVICAAMFSILYKRSEISIEDISEKSENIVWVLLKKMQEWVHRQFQPKINKNTIRVTRYSYSLPDYIYK